MSPDDELLTQLAQLTELMRLPPAGRNALRQNPMFDPLRGDVRFKALAGSSGGR